MITADGFYVVGGSPTSVSIGGDTDPRLLRGVNPAIAAHDAAVASGAIPIALPDSGAARVTSTPGAVQLYNDGAAGVRVEKTLAPGVVYTARVEDAMDGAEFFKLNPAGTIDAPQRGLFASLPSMKLSVPAAGGANAPQGVNARRLAQGAPASLLLTQSPGFVGGKLPPQPNGVSGAQLLPGRGEVVSKTTPQGDVILLALVAVGAWLALR